MTKPARPRLLAPLLLGVVGLLAPLPANAMATYCRSDPVVILSNGSAVDLQAGINDSIADVKSVSYTLHIPAGLYAVGIINTDSLIGLVEKVGVYSNAPAGTYRSSTTVITGSKRVGVAASTTIISALNVTLGTKTTSGLSRQALVLSFTALLSSSP